MPRTRKTPPLRLTAPQARPPVSPALPLASPPGVRLILDGADAAAVEAAAAELKARFGPRFAITGRRSAAKGQGLRLTASLTTSPDNALDALG